MARKIEWLCNWTVANFCIFQCLYQGQARASCRGNGNALGISSNIRSIPDSAMTASSTWQNHPTLMPYIARLNNGITHAAWIPSNSDSNPYLQIDLSKDHLITGAATQGRNGYAQFVKSYQLRYLKDGSATWIYYQINGATKTFQGNSDFSTVVKHNLNNPFTARTVRFYPKTYHGIRAMRVELYGCNIEEPVTETSPAISAFCLADRFGVSIRKNISSFASVTLKDPSCTSTSNRTHITLSTSFSECATSKNETKDHIVVSNEVRMLGAASGIITRGNITIIPFACMYSRSGLEISLESFKPKIKSLVEAQESGFGNFTLRFAMASSASFGSYYSSYPVAVQINDRLYFQISLNANNSDAALLIERCYATSTLNKNDAVMYTLINNRCPADSTVQFHSGAIHHKRFSFLAFNFLNNVPTIYMHCEVYLCHRSSQDSRCTTGCGINKVTRKRRDIEKREIHAEYSKIYVVENGPIQKSKQEQGEQGTSNVAAALPAMGVVLGVLCLILVAIFIVKMRKRVMNKASQKTSDNSNGKVGIENKAMEIDSCA